jgi:hypothetical protein
VKDENVRRRLKALPTTFHLGKADVCLLKDAAKTILRGSDRFQELIKDLQ